MLLMRFILLLHLMRRPIHRLLYHQVVAAVAVVPLARHNP